MLRVLLHGGLATVMTELGVDLKDLKLVWIRVLARLHSRWGSCCLIGRC